MGKCNLESGLWAVLFAPARGVQAISQVYLSLAGTVALLGRSGLSGARFSLR